MVGHWSSSKNANTLYQFERHICLPCTTTVPPLADQWCLLNDHCGDHCASIQRPSQHWSHHGNGSASHCLLCATCCATTAALVVQGRHKGRAAAVHRNRTFWVPATTEHPNHFYGRTKVARRSQPCVKGALTETTNASEHSAVKSKGEYLSNRTKQGSYHNSTRNILLKCCVIVIRTYRSWCEWYAYRLWSFLTIICFVCADWRFVQLGY